MLERHAESLDVVQTHRKKVQRNILKLYFCFRLSGLLEAQMPNMQDLLPEVLPIMNGINVLAEALNDRLQSLPGIIVPSLQNE